MVIPGRHELPPLPGVDYVAFVDPSGGSQDSMTLAHAEGKEEPRPPSVQPVCNHHSRRRARSTTGV